MSVIVIEFVSVDGVVQDPDGTEGTEQGGWAFRYGPGPVAGDKFKLGPLLDTATMLLGRRTWEQFAKLWPPRSDDFSNKMNAIPKLVASRTLPSVDAWNNSRLVEGDVVEEVSRRKATEDLVVVGSASLVHTLMARGLVDEYRLLVFPTVLGQGTRLFDAATPTPPADLDLVSVEAAGPTALVVYRRPATGIVADATDATDEEEA
jgi:dihydrofolate reductase